MDDRITLPELMILGVYLGGPVIAVGLACQVAFLARMGLVGRGLRLKLGGWVITTALLIYALTYVVWIGVPQRYLWWPGTRPGFWPFMWLGIAFTPAVVASVLAVPPMTYTFVRMYQRRRTSG